MEKEEKICTVQSTLNDGDFDDVYQVFLNYERGRERKTALIVCGVLCLICIGMLIAFRNIAFLFYGLGCLVIGVAYIKVPANRKFLAANKLQFGEKRETVFYPHSVTTEELFDEAVPAAEDAEEDENNDAAEFSTTTLQAYETKRGFIFADGRLTNQFLYVPKRSLNEDTEPLVREFAKERCSGGYALLQTGSMLGDDEPEQETEGLTNAVADRYYGRKQLHLYDEDGHRIDFDEEDAEPESDEPAVNSAPPELDVDAALKDILEDTDEPE